MTVPSADPFIGKYVLLGINYIDADNEVVLRRQIHGYIVRRSSTDGMVVRLEDGSEFSLPDNPRALQKAEPGEYYLKEVEEIVVDPDFVAVWTFPIEDLAGEEPGADADR